MPILITRNLSQPPSYAVLSKLAEAHEIRLTGSEVAGSFAGRGATGSYEFTEAQVRGTFTAYGVSGQFLLEPGRATVHVTEKPFWLPEAILTQKITEGLEAFCAELG